MAMLQVSPSPQTPLDALVSQPKLISVKTLTESNNLTSVPATHAFKENLVDHPASDPDEPIPIIDFSLLGGSPDQRFQVIRDLAHACETWGFFMVINHGVPESLMEAMINTCKEFFDQTEEEKQVYEGKNVLDPVRCGTSFNTSVENVFCWRDFLKVFVHPQFYSPSKPSGFSEISLEYCKIIRGLASELLRAISESLGLEASYMHKTLDMEKGFQILIANLYPACPQPELAMGIPPHSDHGLLTFLIQNGVGGLQLQHRGKWVNVNAVPNSFLVNTGDHLEILSNGKYKSVIHRAAVNNKATRLSLAIANGPSLDSMVSPAPELLEWERVSPAYDGMKYRDYLHLQQSNQLDNKFCIDKVRIPKAS